MTLSISFALSLGIAAPAFAAEKYWSWISCGQTNWWDLNCWSATSGGALDGTAQPLDGDNVYLYNSSNFDIGVFYRNTAYPTATLNSLTINATGFGLMRLSYIFNDNLSTITEIVGDTGTGIVDQTTGTHSVTNSLTLGNAATGSGFFNLSSTGTLSAGTIYVGNAGTGTLDIDTGGSVSSTTGYLGNASGSTGTATVSGTGSAWDNSGDLFIGYSGIGTLNINSGATVSNINGYIGYTTGGDGTAIIDGTGTIWDNSNHLYVGRFGNGDLTISNNATVNAQASYMGRYSGLTGTAVVESGGIWNSNAWHTIGQEGTGSLTIQNGGLIDTGTNAYLGYSASGDGTALVDGTGSSWSVNSNMYIGGNVGNGGTGQLLVQNNGNVDVGGLLKLWDDGTLSLAGGSITAGSFDATAALASFSFTDGTFTVDGGTFDDGNTTLTVDSTGVGDNPTLVMSNGASVNYAASNAYIGNSGTGTLNIYSGGLVTNKFGSLGLNAGSNGTATVSGSDAATGTPSTYNSTTLNVGLRGTGTLNIVNGGLVTGTFGYVGSETSGDGTATVSGSDAATGTPSTWDTSTLITVGNLGTGTLNINSGGLVTTPQSFLGERSGTGTATVSGTDAATGAPSTWASSTLLSVGRSGEGTLNINNGGLVTNTNGFLGERSGSIGTVTVSGVDATTGLASTWTNTNSLYVGGSNFSAAGTGLLSIGTGGIVNVTNLLKIWGTGTVELNGGTLNTDSLQHVGNFNFNTGTLNFSNNLSTSSLDSNILLNGLRTLSVNGTTTLDGASLLTLDGGTFSTGTLVDNGGFTLNKGTFNLTGDNLTIGAAGLFGSIVQFGINQTVNVTNTTTIDSGSVLSLANGTFTSGATINNGTVDFDGAVSTFGGGTVTNNGLITGDGRITASLTNAASSEIRVLTGDMLSFTSAGNNNQGAINLLGGAITFDQDLTNDTGGNIVGSGSLAVSGGLANQGTIALSGGTTSILGDVNNTTGGTIIISGNSTATFFDDVMHNGTEFRVSSGSSAVFFGSISGAGSYTGTGSLFFEGDLNPGNSPGLFSVEGDMGLGISSRTIMEIAGLDRGTEYDAFDIGGDLWLDGVLEVSLYDLGSGLFDPQLGDTFDLFSANTISGDFDLLTLATIGGGLGWQMDVLADAIGITDVVRLSVVTASTVPVPPSVWLFGSGLLGLIAIARRRKVA